MAKTYLLSTIDGNSIDTDKVTDFCNKNQGYTLNTSKSKIKIFFQSTSENELILEYKEGADSGSCAAPESPVFRNVMEMAEVVDLFVIGTREEAYFIPQYGIPSVEINFQKLRAIFMSHGNGFNDMRAPRNARLSSFIQKIKTLAQQGEKF